MSGERSNGGSASGPYELAWRPSMNRRLSPLAFAVPLADVPDHVERAEGAQAVELAGSREVPERLLKLHDVLVGARRRHLELCAITGRLFPANAA